MHVTNLDIWQAQSALQEFCKEPWPVKTAYRLAKMVRKVGEHHRDIDQVRIKLIEQHGGINEQGHPAVTPDSPGWNAFAAAWTELLTEETEIDLGPVPLPTTDGFRVTPAVLLALEPFVTVDEE